MNIRIECKNEIVGDGVFWEGQEEHISEIRNIAARQAAKAAVRLSEPVQIGMWLASVVPHEPSNAP